MIGVFLTTLMIKITNVITNYIDELENDNLQVIDVIDDDQFCSYHDLTEYGVLATNCSTFILDKVN